jgi:hypothetical protein
LRHDGQSRQPGALTGTDTPGLRASSLGNANLKPETSAEFEGGFDARLFGSRANFEFTFYRKQTHDALISVPIAPSSAASSLSVLTNVGSTRNSGIEGQITASLFDNRRFGWDVTLSGSHNTNRVVDLGVDPITGKSRVIGTGQTRQVGGYPINGQRFHPYTYADANGDGVIQIAEVRSIRRLCFPATRSRATSFRFSRASICSRVPFASPGCWTTRAGTALRHHERVQLQQRALRLPRESGSHDAALAPGAQRRAELRDADERP